MKVELAELKARARSLEEARSLVQEYLQARILECLQQAGAMVCVAFQGGTALRFLYSLPRFSEGLDFALEGPSARYDLRGWLQRIGATLRAEGYDVEVRIDERRAVHEAWVRLPGLLHEAGLSTDRRQVLSVKVEVDTRPPQGAGLETTLVRRHRILRVLHHDRPSLLAGKLHAVLHRAHPKGRDLYDLLWYMSDRTWPPPNLVLLRNALIQTGWTGPPVDDESWRPIVADRISRLDFGAVARDVSPFLERPGEAALLTAENLASLLRLPES